MEVSSTSELIELIMHNSRTVESGSIRTAEMRTVINLQNAAQVFSEKSFRDIRKICEKSKVRGLKATFNDVTILLYSMAGRIMVTLRDKKDNAVTLVGGEEDSPRSNQMAGLHTMFGETDCALDMLETATHFWYKFKGEGESSMFVEDKEVHIAGM